MYLKEDSISDPFRCIQLVPAKNVMLTKKEASLIHDLGSGEGCFVKFIRETLPSSDIIALDINVRRNSSVRINFGVCL